MFHSLKCHAHLWSNHTCQSFAVKNKKIQFKKSEDLIKKNRRFYSDEFCLKKCYFSGCNIILSNKTLFYNIYLIKQPTQKTNIFKPQTV